jgi:hypothetical protein
MRFLCRARPFPLERLRSKCHLCDARVPELDPAQCIDLQDASGHSDAQIPEGYGMLDSVMLAIGLGFFALSVGYTIACDRL